jgi:uncharacterized protein (DUF736 family)
MDIGTFNATQDGFEGYIKTLTLSGRAVVRPVEQKRSGNSPDFRVFLNGIEVGVAWNRKSQEDNHYLRINIDDPSLPSAIWANMSLVDNQYRLIWTRDSN